MSEEESKSVKSTPFAEFFRYASSRKKRKFFDSIVREIIRDQKAMIEKAEKIKLKERSDKS